ncbi:MAG: amino acid adenylation domain-containing protein, partial [Acidobacteria bacterium]|nr:amino acid adenylation domain-containing protein [Acidobacteriota bacterium]
MHSLDPIKKIVIEEYWLKKLSGELPQIILPSINDVLNEKKRISQSSYFQLNVPPELTAKLRKITKNSDIGLFILFLSALNIGLYRYTGIEDLIVGVLPPMPNVAADSETKNILFCRTMVAPYLTVKEIINRTNSEVMETITHSKFSLADILAELKIKNNHNPLEIFKIALAWATVNAKSDNQLSNPFDLVLSISAVNDPIVLSLTCSSTPIAASQAGEMVERFGKNIIHLLKNVIENLDLPTAELDAVNDQEKKQLLYAFNDTQAEYPRDKTIHEIFAEQAARTPDYIALHGCMIAWMDGEVGATAVETLRATSLQHQHQIQITYRQLNEQSDRLAGLLIEKGVKPDTIIGIKIERSLEMIIGIFGILKAGGAYLPIDPGYPQERIDYMLKDSAARILINKSEIRNPKSETNPNESNPNDQNKNQNSGTVSVLNFGNLNFDIVSNFDICASNLNNLKGCPRRGLQHSNHLAYVIYTSGTTGKPKGAAIEHRSLVNRLNWMQKKYPIDSDDTILQKTTFTFDVSVWEIFWWPLPGAKLFLLNPGAEKEPQIITQVIERHKITVMHFVPSMLAVFLDYIKSGAAEMKLSSLKQVIASGEALLPSHVRQFNALLGMTNRTALANLYGPTEATIDVTYFDCPAAAESEIIPIGKPIDNTRLYILDTNLHLQPIGFPGELFIAGEGLARGYLNRPELTAEKFNQDKKNKSFFRGLRGAVFSKKAPLIYNTGDLARRLPDGNIEFLGRIDHQVKIRGFRIELGEIENRLMHIDGIKDAVVVTQEDAGENKYLYACFVSEREYSTAELCEILARDLPDYMIPFHFVRLDKMPLTPNGKVDRRALPKPGWETGVQYTAPRDETERKLVDLWADILNIKSDLIGIDTSFIKLGGHSLKTMLLAAQIHKEFNVNVLLADIFKMPKVKDLAAFIKGKKNQRFIAIEPAEKKEYYELAAAQKRLYVLQHMNPDSIAYNMPAIIPLPPSADLVKIAGTFKKLIERHESLRTSFFLLHGQPVQKIHQNILFEIETLQPGVLKDVFEHFIRPFDLSLAPLLRVGLVRNPDGGNVLLLDLHHIISDGLSQNVLARDFQALYEQELPPLDIQYKDFSEWKNSGPERESLKVQEKYWLKEYEGELPVLSLPADFKRPGTFTFAGAPYYFKLGAEVAIKFKELGFVYNSTLYMNILAVLGVLFYKYSGHTDMVIGCGTAGRPHADLQHIVGMFVNTLAIRVFPQHEYTYEDFLKETVIRCVKAFENQDVQFDELVDRLALKRDLSRNPLFDVLMVVQNFEKPWETVLNENNQPDVPQPVIEFKNPPAKFDMTFYVHEQGNDIYFNIVYYRDLFKEETVARLALHFKKVIETVLAQPGTRLKDIELIDEAEKERLLYEWNGKAVPYPGDKSIHGLFAEQAVQTPDYIALHGCMSAWMDGDIEMHGCMSAWMDGDIEMHGCMHDCMDVEVARNVNLTYHQLNEQSDRLAGVLIEKGVLPDDILALKMPRSAEMVIAILATLKAGCAYMPVDPDYPQERIQYMLKDSASKILITNNEKKMDNCQCSIVNCQLSMNERPRRGLQHSAFSILHSNFSNLAYIIYTSGSTGKPKGVMVEHRSVVRLVINNDFIDFSDKLRVLQTGAPVFDAVTFEMWGPLLNGGQLYLVDNEVILDPGKLASTLQKYQINTMWLTASLCNQLVSRDSSIFSTLEWLVVGGDVLSPAHINEIRHKNRHLMVVNGYGPTENTTFSVCHRIDRDYEYNIPIGKPIANSTAYIFDKYGRLQPVGVPGELYVGGDGLARGYLNNPELTHKKFNGALRALNGCPRRGLQHSAFNIQHSNLYCTGDLARWLPASPPAGGGSGGVIEFLGRVDSQVKIRGFRVELGEIENWLLRHKEIKEAVVTIAKGEDKLLCAYFTGTRELTAAELREFLALELPGYMIPSYFVQMDKLPLTINGKINREALPAPELKSAETYTAPVD